MASAEQKDSVSENQTFTLQKLNTETEIDRVIRAAFNEDLSDRGDITTLATIPSASISNGYFIAKANGVVSGLSVATKVFHSVDSSLKVDWIKSDGDVVAKGDRIGTVVGKSQSILTAERTALNLMQRMSGIATQTHAMVTKIKEQKSKTILLDTRKTVPGLRVIDKMAVTHGGGSNHRMGLHDMIMIKDNHIAAAGGIAQAITAAVSYLEKHNLRDSVRIEVETTSFAEVELACKEGKDKIHRIMLDNMVKLDKQSGVVDTSMLSKALAIIDGRFESEASGNITLESVGEVAKTNVGFVSTGSITHSVTALDISLRFEDDSSLSGPPPNKKRKLNDK